MSSKESVDEILKEIVVKAVSEYLDQPVNPNLPKTNTKKNIAQRTGISESTLNRYTMPETKSYPNLVEVMEILKVTDKRKLLITFGQRSKCQAAQFVREFYPNYIDTHQLQTDVSSEISSNNEVLRLLNEHQVMVDKKNQKLFVIALMIIGSWMLYTNFYIQSDLNEIKDILHKKDSLN